MLYFIGKRLAQSFVVIFLVILFVFVLMRVAPGDPARLMLGNDATEEEVAQMRTFLGLDRPIPEQFITYLIDIAHGDLGLSMVYNRPVIDVISVRIPNTLRLSWGTILFAVTIAVPLGIYAGVNRGKLIEFICMAFALIGQSMSAMWLGVLLIFTFAVRLGWLPALGTGGIEYMILPIITLGYPMAAGLTRISRSGMVDALGEDHITATYAKGIGKGEVYMKYALKNALIPVITMLGLTLGMSLGGTVIAENMFGWTGLGSLMNQAIQSRDYAMVQAQLLIIASCFAIVNLIVDIILSFVNPRLTLE